MTSRIAALLVTLAVGAIAVALLKPSEPTASADEAQAAALTWIGGGEAEIPRREGDEWEVDVRRENGALVEVTLGPGLALRGFDEERGPGDSLAPDELAGGDRAEAVAAALRRTGRGDIRYVERERDGTIEVGVLRPDGSAFEVELDPNMTVRDVDEESLDDE
jgi:hypothetical protein